MFCQLFLSYTEKEAALGRGETLDLAGESCRIRRCRIGLYSSAVTFMSLTLIQKGKYIMHCITSSNTTPACNTNTMKGSGGRTTRHIGGGCFTHPPKGGGLQ